MKLQVKTWMKMFRYVRCEVDTGERCLLGWTVRSSVTNLITHVTFHTEIDFDPSTH